MSLTPVTRNFASVTRCVFPNRVFFSGGASLRFASSKCFRVGDEKTQKRSRLPSSDFYEYSFAKFEKIAQCSISFANFARNCENSLFYGLNRKISWCGWKPCPDYGRHHWWSSGQDLCFWCRGAPAARVRIPIGAEVGATSESPPKWWPQHDLHTSHMLQELPYDAVTHHAGHLH